jgi:hypothetical protein
MILYNTVKKLEAMPIIRETIICLEWKEVDVWTDSSICSYIWNCNWMNH